jgi:hypothetical protein
VLERPASLRLSNEALLRWCETAPSNDRIVRETLLELSELAPDQRRLVESRGGPQRHVEPLVHQVRMLAREHEVQGHLRVAFGELHGHTRQERGGQIGRRGDASPHETGPVGPDRQGARADVVAAGRLGEEERAVARDGFPRLRDREVPRCRRCDKVLRLACTPLTAGAQSTTVPRCRRVG